MPLGTWSCSAAFRGVSSSENVTCRSGEPRAALGIAGKFEGDSNRKLGKRTLMSDKSLVDARRKAGGSLLGWNTSWASMATESSSPSMSSILRMVLGIFADGLLRGGPSVSSWQFSESQREVVLGCRSCWRRLSDLIGATDICRSCVPSNDCICCTALPETSSGANSVSGFSVLGDTRLVVVCERWCLEKRWSLGSKKDIILCQQSWLKRENSPCDSFESAAVYQLLSAIVRDSRSRKSNSMKGFAREEVKGYMRSLRAKNGIHDIPN